MFLVPDFFILPESQYLQSCNFELLGIDVDHSSIYDWICKYSEMVSKYLNDIVPRTNNRTMVRADEVWIKVNGEQKYLFASMDDDTRYWLASDMAHTKFQHNADTLLELTKEKIGKNPTHFVTDGLKAYMKSSKKVFGKGTNHIRHIHLKGKRSKDNNNKMERLNGEIRDREKVFRGLKRFDTPLIDGQLILKLSNTLELMPSKQIQYNYHNSFHI